MDLTDRLKLEPPSLSDMPNEIIDEITGKLVFMDRLVVRKVSPYLRDVIDKRNPEIGRLSITFSGDTSQLQYGWNMKNEVKYSQVKDKCVVEYDDRKQMIEGGDHIKLSINDLAIVLKNPKLRLEGFCFNMYLDQSLVEKYSKHLKSLFESLKDQISTKDVFIGTSFLDAAMSILPFLKPGTLESISFFSNKNDHPAMGEIVKLDQWKQAKSFNASSHNFSVSIEHLFHFNSFFVNFQSISLQDMLKIRDVLLKSPNFEFAKISMSEGCNVNELKQIFLTGFPRDIDVPGNYKVPGSENVFKVCIRSDYISIHKTVL